MLENKDWSEKLDTVQPLWDIIENNIIQIVDEIVPLKSFVNYSCKSIGAPTIIKRKMNQRNKLLTRNKIVKNQADLRTRQGYKKALSIEQIK
jgi:hypothetical protein